MSNVKIRSVYQLFYQAITAQVKRDARSQVKSNVRTTASRITYFTRMNPPLFFGSKVEEEIRFIDDIFKVIDGIGVSQNEKTGLASYKFKDMAQV